VGDEPTGSSNLPRSARFEYRARDLGPSPSEKISPPLSGSPLKKPQTVTQLLPFSSGFLSPTEAAHYLGIAKKTVLSWCQSGKIPAISKSYGNKTTFKIPEPSIRLTRIFHKF
jgi:excisionase family DNA binding protein